MSVINTQKYQELLNLDEDTEFIKIDHDEGMVATVYKVLERSGRSHILKICESHFDYANEVYFLGCFSKQILVPKVIRTVPPGEENLGALLIEYLPGNLLTPHTITQKIAFEVGKSLAIIHENKTNGFGYLNRNLDLSPDPTLHFKAKFEEGIDECKGHLPDDTIFKSLNYFNNSLNLLEKVDGPCIIHRDFRPGNIIIHQDSLRGIIDWSSARSGFAEDDFCSIEHGEWRNFNSYKNIFLDGYQSIRTVPHYKAIIPLLRLNRAIALIGFTVKRNTWNNIHVRPYKFNREYIDMFDFENS